MHKSYRWNLKLEIAIGCFYSHFYGSRDTAEWFKLKHNSLAGSFKQWRYFRRHCAKARNLGGFSGSDAGRSELRSEQGLKKTPATSTESVMEGWRLGKGKRGGLKGSLAEILGKSSVKSHQNIPLPKPPLTRTIPASYQWYPPRKILIATFSSVMPKQPRL